MHNMLTRRTEEEEEEENEGTKETQQQFCRFFLTATNAAKQQSV